MSLLRTVVTVLASVVLVVSCGVDDGDVDDLAGLPGVEDASSSCTLGDCLLSVTASSDITSRQLDTVLRDARAIGASDTNVTVGEVRLSFDQRYDGSGDTSAVALALAARSLSKLDGLGITLSADGTDLTAQVVGTRDELWATARSLWDELDGVPGRTLSATSTKDVGRNRISVSGSFPTAAVDFVQDFGAADLLTGVVIDEGRVLLGTSSTDLSRRVESAVDDDPGAVDLDVDVVLATNVLEYRPDSGGAQQQVRAMVEAMEAVAGPRVSVVGTTVRVSAEVGSLEDIESAITDVRREQPEVGATVPVTVVIGTEATVELETTGSPDLLNLADLVLGLDGVTELTVSSRRVDRSPPPPPADTEQFVAITVASDDLDESVSAVATVFAGWEPPPSSLSVSVTAVDPEGRKPSVILRVDRRGDTWVPSTLERGTPEGIAAGIRAWRAGS